MERGGTYTVHNSCSPTDHQYDVQPRLVRVIGMAEEPPLRAMLDRLKMDMNKIGLQNEFRSYVAFDEVTPSAFNCHRIYHCLER